MGVAMFGARGVSRSRTALHAARAAARALDLEPSDIHEWALREFRSTSPWAVGQALAALGRHHSRPWLGRIDVPTAVVVGTADRVIAAARQLSLARAIPGATIHDIDAGHAACVLEAEKFVPVVVEAVNTVNARRRDFARGRRPRPAATAAALDDEVRSGLRRLAVGCCALVIGVAPAAARPRPPERVFGGGLPASRAPG